MKNLRRKFERFCFQNRNKGIPNLMLWIVIANVVVFFIDRMDPQRVLWRVLSFDRAAILHGEVWRLFTFILLEFTARSNLLWLAIAAIFYYQLGLAIENSWGRLRFNLYYLTGIVFMWISGFLFNYSVSPASLHISLFLAYATMYPDNIFAIFFIIPVRARWLGIFNLALYLLDFLQFHSFPNNLAPLFPLANYLLYFGSDIANIFPISWRVNADRVRRKVTGGRNAKKIIFPTAGSYEASTATVKGPYTHRCTICGRTDVSNPELDFRYCSRCKGYHCYCQDHISTHTHIEE